MRTIFTSFLAILFLFSTATAKEKQYGKKLTIKQVTKVSDIMANPENYKGKTVLVEGLITDVCPKRGCWIRLASDKEFETITFKVEDGVIVFPMEAKGKQARAQGVVSVRTISVEEQIEQGKNRAEETGEEFDPASIKGPRTIIRLEGVGAVIK